MYPPTDYEIEIQEGRSELASDQMASEKAKKLAGTCPELMDGRSGRQMSKLESAMRGTATKSHAVMDCGLGILMSQLEPAKREMANKMAEKKVATMLASMDCLLETPDNQLVIVTQPEMEKEKAR